MHKLDKSLSKLSKSDRDKMLLVLVAIESRHFDGLDLKKLRGVSHRYRVRVGKMRVIFEMTDEYIHLVDITKRSDNTYNF